MNIELLNALFPSPEEQLPRLKDEKAQVYLLERLAVSYGCSGQPSKAIPCFKLAIEISEKQNDKINLAMCLGDLSIFQFDLGDLQAADTNSHRSIALYQEPEQKLREAHGHCLLGKNLAYRGILAEAEAEF